MKNIMRNIIRWEWLSTQGLKKGKNDGEANKWVEKGTITTTHMT